MIGDGRTSDKKIMISIENLKGHVQNIHFDRNPYDHYRELEQAAQYIEREFLKSGWEVKEDRFQWEGRSYKNIVAEKKGTISPNRVFILGAHYDTVPGSPGADDNASAIAVLLEVASNIQTVPLGCTVRLIAFSLEECDYIGSTHYVESLKKGEEKILGMISLEMVGFTGPGKIILLTSIPNIIPMWGILSLSLGMRGRRNYWKRFASLSKLIFPSFL